MSELHKFLFDGLPVRGMIVRLTDAWTEILKRRAGNTATGAYPAPVSELLGEMAAAGVLMQSNICLLYTSPSPRDQRGSRMPSSA